MKMNKNFSINQDEPNNNVKVKPVTSVGSNIILWGFYIFVFIICIVVFMLFRTDRYEFYLVKDEVFISKGSSYQVELTPKNARYFDYLNYEYEISDPNIAKVDEYGTITAVGNGITTLNISLKPGLIKKEMKIVTDNVEINSIDLLYNKEGNLQQKETVNMKTNQSINFKATANKDKNMNTTVKYSSSNPNVATVDDFGNVTAKSEGIAVISGERNGVSGQTTIVVNKENSPSNNQSSSGTSVAQSVTKVEIGVTQVTKYENESISLFPTITPSNARYSNMTWTTSNSKVATVTQKGVVTALKKGTAVITVDVDGKKDTCTIIVREKITITPTTPKPTSTIRPSTTITPKPTSTIKPTMTNTPKPTSTVKPTVTPTPIVKAPSGTQISVNEVKLSKTSITIDMGKTDSFDIKVNNIAGAIDVSSSNTNIVKVELANSGGNCNGLMCFYDCPGANESKTYKITGVGKGEAYINVTLTDVASYDEKTLTGSGKIGILVK